MTTVPRPELGQFTPFTFPEPELQRIGDINVELYDAPENAVAAVAIVTPSGDLRDPAELPGLSRLQTEMRGEGTRTLPGSELRRALDACGAHLFTETSRTHTAAAVAVPDSLITRASELLAQSVREPLFTQEALSRLTRIAIESLRVEEQIPGLAASRAMAKLEYPEGSRSSFPDSGTEQALKAMTLAALEEFTSQFVIPAGSTLLIALPQSAEREREAILESFAWSAAGTEPAPLDRITTQYRPVVRIIDRADAVQTALLWSVPAARRTTQAGADLRLATYALGGSLSSRLSSVLREDLGLTYGISAMNADNGASSTLRIGTSVDSTRTGEALVALKDTIAKALDGGISDDEISSSRTEIERGTPLKFENVSSVIDERIGMLLHGESIADYRNRDDMLREVTGESATAQLRAHLDANKPQLVLVGNASDIESAVRETFPECEVSVESL